MKIAGMWMRVGWFVILLTLRSAWGIAETYQYAFGTYTPDEAVRLTNQCSTLYKFNCGTADIKVTGKYSSIVFFHIAFIICPPYLLFHIL